MKAPLITFTFLLSILAACAQLVKPEASLSKQWETGPGLKVPESVLYDSVTGLIFVSNVNGNPTEKDSNGYISTLSPEGKILKADWVTELDAPKGMGILNNKLYVTNIDEVAEIDIPTASIINRYPVEGSRFLNDIAIDPKTGMIFITDTDPGQVYVLFDGKVSSWLQGDLFKGANGLFLKGSKLYIGTGNSILQADINTGEVQVTIPNSGNVDGLFVTSEGRFIFSDWKGSVFVVALNGRPELLLNTSAHKVNAADFGIISNKNYILIPTFGDNKVVCYSSPVIK
jgi:DNA-binding beta-propeller fold protein YncE